MPQQTLFYCVDEDLRQAGCFIYDPYREGDHRRTGGYFILALFSRRHDGGIFITARSTPCFLYDLSSKTLTRKYPFQARGLPGEPGLFRGWD